MTGSGLGMELAGRIIHVNSDADPAAKNQSIMNRAFEIGVELVKKFQELTISDILFY